jgi:hypothetical protein
MIQIFKSGINIIPKYIELKYFNKIDNRWGLTNLDILNYLIKNHMN